MSEMITNNTRNRQPSVMVTTKDKASERTKNNVAQSTLYPRLTIYQAVRLLSSDSGTVNPLSPSDNFSGSETHKFRFRSSYTNPICLVLMSDMRDIIVKLLHPLPLGAPEFPYKQLKSPRTQCTARLFRGTSGILVWDFHVL
jgi:hypothetical protein